MSSVDVIDLSVRAGKKVLISKVTLAFEPGTWTTIIGPNERARRRWSRRSLALRPPSEGSVSLLGDSLAVLNETGTCAASRARPTCIRWCQAGCACTTTSPSGELRTTVSSTRPTCAIVRSLIQYWNVSRSTSFRDRDVATLSGGERQRMVPRPSPHAVNQDRRTG